LVVTTDPTATPLILIPGIQGRWEWLGPAIRALAPKHQVLTFSLGEVDGPRLFDRWTSRIDQLLDTAGRQTADVVGVSFGGLVAAWYAAHRPDRVTSLVLVAAPSPRWSIDDQSARYARYPRLSLPLFALRAARRLAPEVASAMPGWGARLRFGTSYAARAVRYPASPRQMASVVDEWRHTDLTPIAGRVAAPTLIITGENDLDRVVPVESTLEYLSLIPGAVHARLPRTGHIGFISKPAEFAALVSDFIHASRSGRTGGCA
jgi:pimeloyl-ACP methyl ester carboxylesterase